MCDIATVLFLSRKIDKLERRIECLTSKIALEKERKLKEGPHLVDGDCPNAIWTFKCGCEEECVNNIEKCEDERKQLLL